jgi:hypothetical protein
MFHLIFPFDVFSTKMVLCVKKTPAKVKSKCIFKIDWRPISIRQSDENRIVKMVNEIKNCMKIELKVGLCEHFELSMPKMWNRSEIGHVIHPAVLIDYVRGLHHYLFTWSM